MLSAALEGLAKLPFRQSYAKVLLTDSAAHLRHQLEHGRVATKAMERGSLFDYLVFGLDSKYEVVDATYRSGDRAGQQCVDWQGKDAQLAAKEARERGLLPVLPAEIEDPKLQSQVQCARVRFLQHAEADDVFSQQLVRWFSSDDLVCEGTPDWILLNRRTGCVRTVDLKKVASVNPRKLRRQVDEMCWDMQGAAYREAALAFARSEVDLETDGVPFYGGHSLLACEQEGIGLVRLYPLDDAFMAGGQRKWQKAQREWQSCVLTGSWPAYPEEPLSPAFFYVRTWIESEETTPEEEP